ncbi:MAG: phosphoribosyl-AMP cyclohydrolase [Planctomycetota bacterium]
MRTRTPVVSAVAALIPCSLFVGACASTQNSQSARDRATVTEADVLAAQQEWGQGIVDISRVHGTGGDFRARATRHINALYAYGDTDVMFKPTLAAEDQFRESFDEALAYFIGRAGTEDTGFAIKGWTNVRWENNGIYTDRDSAMAMGNYFFTGADGSVTKVEYTFGYVVDPSGNLKINLHHSSLPYTPQ